MQDIQRASRRVSVVKGKNILAFLTLRGLRYQKFHLVSARIIPHLTVFVTPQACFPTKTPMSFGPLGRQPPVVPWGARMLVQKCQEEETEQSFHQALVRVGFQGKRQ